MGVMPQHFSIVKRPDHAIESVDNALLLIDLLRRHPQEGVRVQDVAAYLGVAPSSAHRLLSTLLYRGFVTRGPARQYRPGPALGVAETQGTQSVPGPVLEILAQLSADTGETVSLLRRRGVSVVFLTTVESRQRLRVGERTGTVLPARLTSGGKALLAALDDVSIRALYAGGRSPGERLAGSDLERLLAEMDEVRAQGFALNLRQTESDISAVGIAVPHSSGLPPRDAVALSAPAVRTTALTSERSIDLVRRACADLAGLELVPESPPPAD
ncbi:IclR family transcriptional regulator [Mycobacteroides abscessus subsp. abscessus]|uniref:IclR family transcriptional regulator n=3 Tax=Brevibacterium casei TaxID=33889 RepID=K9ALX1_9MICO|nr:IclR family transcriptional regulator [Brevibacterium casei S18]SIG89979.1 IclR family transcriptional regulator [Mycobacteroides abscessus subsp. abscessus]SMX63660.1 transcriptional regulator, IclR family [Brevibacterium casei CIP 102111]